MNIAIIGASSFLAKDLTAVLSSKDELKLKLYSRSDIRTNKQHQWIPFNFPAQLLDNEQLLSQDVIFYCAGAGIQPRHQDNNQLIYEMNAFEPIRLISRLKDLNYNGKIICFGSYFEIGNLPSEITYSEDDLATHSNPMPNAYCTAKNLLTRYIHTELRQEEQLPFVLQHFILSNIYGANENSNRLLPYIVQSCVKGEVLSFTSGQQFRQYTHIRDISNFLDDNLQSTIPGIFNLTDDTMITVRHLIEKTLQLVQSELGISPEASFGSINKRDVSMKYLGLNTNRVQKYFNFVPAISLERGIIEYILKYANN